MTRTLQGADVSHYQLTTPSASVASWVFGKATEGTTYVDPGFTGHAWRAKSAGQLFGAYHFAHPLSLDAQARFFIQYAGNARALAVDNDGVPPLLDRSQTRSLISLVRQHDPLHRTITLYMSLGAPYFYGCGQDFNWVAAYGTTPMVYDLHQWTDHPSYDHDVAISQTKLDAIFGVVAPPPTQHLVHIAKGATVIVETLGHGGCIATVNGHYGTPTYWSKPDSKAACDAPVQRRTCDGKSHADTVYVRSGAYKNHHIRVNAPSVFVTP